MLTIINGHHNVFQPGRTCLGFAPVVDGEGGFIPDVPVNLRMREEFHKVPEMIGINRHESFLSVVGPGSKF